MTNHDTIQRFVFENIPVRGEFVHLNKSYEIIKSHQQYPTEVAELLGQTLVGATLLSNILKFNGWLILQVHGEGPVKLMLAQADAERHVRGLAHWDENIQGSSFQELVAKGRIVITINLNDTNERYQGIVEIKGDTLATSLENYFLTSEQLPTFLFLASNKTHAAGLLLQVLPETFDKTHDLTWEHLIHLSRTLTAQELLTLPNEQILKRLFHEEDIRLFESEPVSFYCNCSRERMEKAILTMTYEDAIEHAGKEKITVTCEFCNRSHSFDIVDVETIFSHKKVEGNQQLN